MDMYCGLKSDNWEMSALPGSDTLGTAGKAYRLPRIRTMSKGAQGLEATPLGPSSEDYRVTHFRYDFAKLPARHPAERIGTSRHYRLERIGRIVCETLENGSAAANLRRKPECLHFPLDGDGSL